MFSLLRKYRLKFITITFWLWLLYIIAALVWWFISLEMQNNQIFEIKKSELFQNDVLYAHKLQALQDARSRKSIQYIGEGVVSIVFILFGAVFLYHHTRKQFRFAQQQQNFMMAITHELKTPIAVTQLNLETLLKRKLSQEQQQKLLSNTLIETSRLHSLTNNILFSTQLESGQYRMSLEPVNISSLVIDMVKEYRRRFTHRDIEHWIEENIFILGEMLMLQLVLSNLIDNAIKYSGNDSTIKVALKLSGENVVITIADNGTGISDDEKNKIFNKFYRVGNESVRKAKGTGLGLYLCKKIVKDLKGSIYIENNEPNGSKFFINFPIEKI